MFREAVLGELGKDEAPVHFHLERAERARLEQRLDPGVLFDVGRQTGGPRQIVSGDAVVDRDRHDAPAMRAAFRGLRYRFQAARRSTTVAP